MWIVRLTQRPYTFAVLALLIVVMGVTAISQMRTDIFPETDIPVATVIWAYKGMESSEVERRITTCSDLVSAHWGAYHCQQGGKDGPRLTTRQPRLTRAGTIMPVDESPLTRASLLLQIRDGANHAAWQEFVGLYGPVVYGFARKRGLQDADAADLMQDVLRSVSSAIGRLDYDRNQGSFRGWLFTITRNKVFNFLSARRIRPQGSGDTTTNRLLNAEPAPSDDSEGWELEYQRRLASLAMERVKGEFQTNTWRAFWLTAVEGVGAIEVAKQLGMSPGAIYVAKSRVLARLKEEIETMRQQEEE